jgi:hypothetical protein
MHRSTSLYRFLACAVGLAGLLFAHPAKAAPEPSAPNAVVQEFYTAHFKDFDSTGPGLRKKEKWLSKGCLGSIHAWQKRSAKNVPKGDVGDIDIDLFTNAQDTPKTFKLGNETVKGAKAEVPVTFTIDKDVYKGTVLLVMEDGAWKIDNIQFKDMNLRKLLDSADLKKSN